MGEKPHTRPNAGGIYEIKSLSAYGLLGCISQVSESWTVLKISLRQLFHFFYAQPRQVRTQSAKCIFQACVLSLLPATVTDNSLRVNIIIKLGILHQKRFFTLQRINSHKDFEILTVKLLSPSRLENFCSHEVGKG